MVVAPNLELLDDFLSEFVNEDDEFVKEAAAQPKDELRFKQRAELDMWHTWNNGGRKPEHLKPLMESYKPVLQRHANTWVNRVEMPTSTINHEFQKQFVHAVKTYDPSKKAQLSSWVYSNLAKSTRYMKTYQNLGKIPESQISKIREFNKAKEYLTDLHGHEPDTHMMADHLKLPIRKVAQLQKELSRKDKPTSGYPDDPATILTPKELEAVRILQYDHTLSNEEKLVYEYTYGINGRPSLKPGEISTKTKIHPSKISRIRKKLQKKMWEAAEVL